MSRYYDLYDDVDRPDRWELGPPCNEQGEELEPWWQFKSGQPVTLQEALVCHLSTPGEPLDFSHASFSIPILSLRAKELLQRFGCEDLQFFPIRVESMQAPYFLMNVVRLLDCVDEARCLRTEKWTPADGHPERVGDYRVVEGLRIDPARVEGARILRPRGWPVLVVAQEVKQAMEQAGLTGMHFTEV